MAPISLPSFDTLEDAARYQGVYVRDYVFPDIGEVIIPIRDIDACEARVDCRGCLNLQQKVTGEVEGVFLRGEHTPSFALCQRGLASKDTRLISIRYPIPIQDRSPPVVHFGSTQCPREFGEHPQ